MTRGRRRRNPQYPTNILVPRYTAVPVYWYTGTGTHTGIYMYSGTVVLVIESASSNLLLEPGVLHAWSGRLTVED